MIFTHAIAVMHVVLATTGSSSGISMPPPTSSLSNAPVTSPSIPNTITVNAGVVIAHGHELPPPFILTITDNTLWIQDGAGRHFATRDFADSAGSQSADERLESLANAKRSIDRRSRSMSPGQPADMPVATHEPAYAHLRTPLSIQMAQIAHLLSAGGILAFGHTYALVFPPNRAEAALPEIRWVAAHVSELATMLPLGHPLFRDLVQPSLTLAPAAD